MLALVFASFPLLGAIHIKAVPRLAITRLVGRLPVTDVPIDAGGAEEEDAVLAFPLRSADTPTAGCVRGAEGVRATGVVEGVAGVHVAGIRQEGLPLGTPVVWSQSPARRSVQAGALDPDIVFFGIKQVVVKDNQRDRPYF
ncbi:MAG: hypothetical protein CMP20_15415 [Rickettsiales bacterium]|nr:hypothetical protein [Rickettsiales bacterium]